MPNGDSLDLVGAAEIAVLLRVSRQRVTQLTNTPGFPPPALRLKMGTLWRGSDVRAWAALNRPPRGTQPGGARSA